MATDQALNVIAASVNCRRPNKPVLPTAPNWLDDNSFDPVRRHIGQPLGVVMTRWKTRRDWAGALSGTVRSGITRPRFLCNLS
jgi:hypothetical protein